MTYHDIKQKVLELMDRASVAGVDISPAYNGQSDLLRRIPGLVNDALLRCREVVPLHKRAVYTPEEGEARGALVRYPLPADFMAFRTESLWRVEGETQTPVTEWEQEGRGFLVKRGTYLLRYCALPALLPADPGEETEAAEDGRMMAAACYYAAAMLSLGEDVNAYTALLREFRERLDALSCRWCDMGATADVYGFGG